MANSLLAELNRGGVFSLGYADDDAILVRGFFLQSLIELMREALKVVKR